MATKIRIPDWNIPFQYRERFPIWRGCLDEEGVEGQTESTFRPHETKMVEEWSELLVATAFCRDGRSFPATIVLDPLKLELLHIMVYFGNSIEENVAEVSLDNHGGPYWNEYDGKPNWYHNWVSVYSIQGLVPFRVISAARRLSDGRQFEVDIDSVEAGMRIHRRKE